jgi:hypothetical protein
MDRFRVRAIEKILSGNILSPEDRAAAVAVLLEKIDVYLDGARKRGKTDEIRLFEAIRENFKNTPE